MKYPFLVIICSFFFHITSSGQSDFDTVNSGLIEEEHSEKTRSLFIWVPGILAKSASLFIDKDEEPELKHTLRFLGGLTIRILNGNPESEKWQRKTARWERKIKRKKLDDLMVVRHENNTVLMKAGLPGKGKIKNYAFLIKADDNAVLLIGKSRLDLNKIMKLVNKMSS